MTDRIDSPGAPSAPTLQQSILELVDSIGGDSRWTREAVEDFFVLVLLLFEVDAKHIGPVARNVVDQFSTRIGVLPSTGAAQLSDLVAAHFDKSPLPPAMIEKVRQRVHDIVSTWGTTRMLESVKRLLGQQKSTLPQPGDISNPNSLFQLRLKRK